MDSKLLLKRLAGWKARGEAMSSAPRRRRSRISRRVFFEPLEDRRLLAGFQINLSGVFNQDAIRNRSNGTDDAMDVAVDDAGSRLVTDSYAANQSTGGNGLPDDGFFPETAFHPPVQLGYRNEDDGNNVVFLPDSGNSVTVPVPAGLVASLHVFALSTGGATGMRLTLTYADGEETLDTQVADWFEEVVDGEVHGDAVRYTLIDGLDRFDGNSIDDADDPAVFGHRFAVDLGRPLLSVTIVNANPAVGDARLIVLGATTDSSIDLATLDGNNGFRIDGEARFGRSGHSVSSAGDVNGDGFDDMLIGAPGVFPGGASYVVFGKASGFEPHLNLATLDGDNGFRLTVTDPGDLTGVSVSDAGDVNGDGFDDVIIGADEADADGFAFAGASYVLFGKPDSFAASMDLEALDGTIGFRIDGAGAFEFSGESVSSAGDVNGDGFDDLLIGAHGADPDSRRDAGASYVVFGKARGFPAALSLASLDGTNGFQLNGIDASDLSGISVSSAGDVNGDGFDDVIIGAPAADPDGDTAAGESYVVFGRSAGFPSPLDLAALDGTNGFRIEGVMTQDRAGASVGNAGDVNGDGFDDLLIAADPAAAGGAGIMGESYVVYGKAHGFPAVLELSAIDGIIGFRIGRSDAAIHAGLHVSGAGDVNGDGVDDLIIGAYDAEPGGMINAGQSFLVFGRQNGSSAFVDLAGLNGGDGFRIDGLERDLLGRGVSGAGDVNGDGFDDLIIGADGVLGHSTDAGKSYILFGGDFTGTVTHAGTEAVDVLVGTSSADAMIAGRGDDTLVGEGGPDVLRGGEGDDIFAVPDTGFARIVGGNGQDTLRLDGSGVTLDLTIIADNRIVDVEAIDITVDGPNTVTLDFQGVVNISSHSNTLRLIHDELDTINYGAAWDVVAPALIDDTFLHILKLEAATIEVANTLSWQNPFNHLDANRDEAVSPVDALVIINKLNDEGSQSLPPPTIPGDLAVFHYLDTNGDLFVSPVDALLVINFLNAPTANTEGEDSTPDRVWDQPREPILLPPVNLGESRRNWGSRRDAHDAVFAQLEASDKPSRYENLLPAARPTPTYFRSRERLMSHRVSAACTTFLDEGILRPRDRHDRSEDDWLPVQRRC